VSREFVGFAGLNVPEFEAHFTPATHDPADDFEHPSLPPGHPQRPHVLYRAAAR
jgi:hypothetical protein